MSTCNLIAFSLCSKATKSHVMHLKNDIQQISIKAFLSIDINILSHNQEVTSLVFFKKDYGRWNFESCESVTATETLTPLEPESDRVWVKRGFKLRDWIDHVMEIFNCSRIHEIYISRIGHEEHYISLSNAVKELKTETIFFSFCSDTVVQSVVANVQSNDISFNLSFNIEPSMQKHKVLTRHFERVSFSKDDTREALTLNDLLITNVSQLNISAHHLSFEELNIFIRHLISGSNRRLKIVGIVCAEATRNMQILLKGISHSVYSAELKIVARNENDYQLGDTIYVYQNCGRRLAMQTYLFEGVEKIVMRVY